MSMKKSPAPRSNEEFHPKSNYIVGDTQDTIVLNLPGFQTAQLRVQLDNGYMKITGERPANGNGEIRFQKDFRIPGYCDPQQIRAYFENEKLSITIPKTTPPPPETKKPAGPKPPPPPEAKKPADPKPPPPPDTKKPADPKPPPPPDTKKPADAKPPPPPEPKHQKPEAPKSGPEASIPMAATGVEIPAQPRVEEAQKAPENGSLKTAAAEMAATLPDRKHSIGRPVFSSGQDWSILQGVVGDAWRPWKMADLRGRTVLLGATAFGVGVVVGAIGMGLYSMKEDAAP